MNCPHCGAPTVLEAGEVPTLCVPRKGPSAAAVLAAVERKNKLSYGLKEAALLLGVSVKTVRREIDAGHIVPLDTKLRLVLISADELRRWVRERTHKPKGICRNGEPRARRIDAPKPRPS